MIFSKNTQKITSQDVFWSYRHFVDRLINLMVSLNYITLWGDCNGKSFNQKLKLLYIMQMLKENTDENHAMSANDIISALAKQRYKCRTQEHL